ncbi:MAG: hypothetical protein PHE89_05975 [Alphaproteobacteria bacterium]|nr:hypothetical protein [Alphaproteobacteria bacterium]
MSNNLSMLEISELVCTRISHDLVGNIGAVSNAVELLEDGDMDFLDDIKNILKSSSFILASRMKFFRMIFGANNANLDNLDLVKKTTADYIKTICGNYDVTMELELQDGRFSKVAMLCVMIVADTFVRGGQIIIKQKEDRLIVSSENKSMLKDKVFIIKEVINDRISESLAQYAPILYLKEILKETKYSVKTSGIEGLEIIVE